MKHKPKLLDLFCGGGGCSMGYHLAGFEVVGVDINPQKRYPFEFHQEGALTYLRQYGHEFDAIHASPPCQCHSVLRHLPSFNPAKHEDLIESTRRLLQASGKPYVMENVPGAPLRNPFTLCGTMFGLRTECGAELRRHRLFETNWFDDLLEVPLCQHYAESPLCVTGRTANDWKGIGERRRSIGLSGTGNAMTGARRTIGIHGTTPRDPAAEMKKYRPGRGKTVSITGSAPLQNTVRNLIRETFPVEQARKAMGISWMTMKERLAAVWQALQLLMSAR